MPRQADDAGPQRRRRLNLTTLIVRLLSAWTGTLLGVAVVSGIPLCVFVLLPSRQNALRSATRWLVGFATGALLGAALLHLVPEALRWTGHESLAAWLVLTGFLGFFVLERYLWVHEHLPTNGAQTRLPPLAALNLLGDAVHNLIDGMAIAAAFLTTESLGVATTVAVVLHEVPQEIGDFGILLYAGLSRRKALAWNVASALVAFAGALAVLALGPHVTGMVPGVVPLAAGGFLYIAASDLLPRLKEETSNGLPGGLFLAIGAGVAVTALPLLWGAG